MASRDSYTSASLPRAVTVVPSLRESSACSPPSSCSKSLQPPLASSSATEPSSSYASSPSDSPSIYVTFKVLQLVHVFRQRVTRKLKAHRQATKKASSKNTIDVDGDFCQGFERQAYDEIDRYLGRKIRPRSKQSRQTKKSCLGDLTKDEEGVKGTDWLLRQLDHSVKFGSHSIDIVAKNNRRFLQHQSSLSIDRRDVQQLCELLVTVRSLKDSVGEEVANERGAFLHFLVDDTHAANLQHLLLRLESELLLLLVRRLVELVHRHVSDCQKDQSKRSEEWFFEFPNARHPLSTTWPWSIKPSLAVLWGVCWMFYDRLNSAPLLFDKEGNMVNRNGDIELPADEVIAFLSQQQQRTQHQYQQQQMQSTATSRQAMVPQHAAAADPRFPRTHHQTSPSRPSADAQPRNGRMPRGGLTSTSSSPRNNHLAHHAGTSDQAPLSASGLAVAHTNNSTAFATQPPSTHAQDIAAWPLPEDNFPTLGFASDSAYSPTAAIAGWNQGVSATYPPLHAHAQQQLHPLATRPAQFGFGGQAALPPRSRHPSTPSIRVTTDFPQQYHQQQPQDFSNYSAATSISTNSSVPLQETPSYPNYQNHFNSGHLSPHSPYMADTLPEVRDMQTTTPPRSPHDHMPMGPMGEPMTRKRSHSQISNGPPFPQADGSHHGSQVGAEEFSPGRIEINRPEPLMNGNRKYLCNFGGEECGHLIFDRKCEWSKHMDKHDRPYRCQDPGCAKLQGFTYSGGLLRHEREVHGKHGGPKAQMRCPHEDCKRHTGKGFTRKENLNEHIRRVHGNREGPLQPDPNIMKHDTTFDALAGAARAIEESTVETPASRVSEAVMVEDPELHSPATKRRRHNMQSDHGDRSASEGVEDLRRQIEHLQQENAQKDQRLMDMERMVAEMDRRFQEQQRAQNEMYDQQQAAAAAAAIATAAQQA